jgi:hypothetical protein
VTLTTIKYGPNGNQIWKTSQMPTPFNFKVQVEGAALDNLGDVFLVALFKPLANAVCMYKYADSGTLLWGAIPDPYAGPDAAHGLVVDNSGSVLLTGPFSYFGPDYSYGTAAYGTYKADANGSFLWTNLFPLGPVPPSAALGIALDEANSSYVTGYSPGTNSDNDIVTIKYAPNGNQIWQQRYNGPGNGNDAGNAIAVDANGNVYVAGYDTTAAGGTEMVLIKYSSVTIQRHADGTVLLEAEGSPGESFDIQASSDLLNWLDLGSVLADTNGLMQFDDTNAPNYPRPLLPHQPAIVFSIPNPNPNPNLFLPMTFNEKRL